ncbi:MAG: FAD-dependent oxidoreductase [Planctomycetes bacterium]|nr:FAD-dependent oxidoreductase [Planctomycetota bacterium]
MRPPDRDQTLCLRTGTRHSACAPGPDTLLAECGCRERDEGAAPECLAAVCRVSGPVLVGGQVLRPCRDNVGGLTHFWEYGQWLDPFADAEKTRDHLLCSVYGTFANVKRNVPVQAANLELEFVGHVPAGGESRRLMGDYMLTENDICEQRAFPDSVANQSGRFCLHYPGDEHDFRLGDGKLDCHAALQRSAPLPGFTQRGKPADGRQAHQRHARRRFQHQDHAQWRPARRGRRGGGLSLQEARHDPARRVWAASAGTAGDRVPTQRAPERPETAIG